MAQTYATRELMINKFGAQQLNRLTGAANADNPALIDDEKLSRAIDEAQSTIDAYIESVVPLPIPAEDIPVSLQYHACNIAFYELAPSPTEGIEKRYDAAISFLKAVQAGRVSLGLDADDEPTSTSGGVMSSGSTPGHQRFYRDDR